MVVLFELHFSGLLNMGRARKKKKKFLSHDLQLPSASNNTVGLNILLLLHED